jgi:DNA-binding CsgD family transcriptional regulator
MEESLEPCPSVERADPTLGRPHAFDGKGLTASERATIDLVLRGSSNAEVARARQVAVNTVTAQLTSAYRKLGVGGRRELRARWPCTSTLELRASPPEAKLSAREREVLVFTERGYANKVIADALGVRPSTVSTLLTRARRKLVREAPTTFVLPRTMR